MINSWKKVLSISDVGKAKMHDKYLNIPKEIKRKGKIVTTPFTGTAKSAEQFYGRRSGRPGKENWVFVEHIDKKTGQIYKARFEYAKKSNQFRLYKLAECYSARKAMAGDEFVVEKIKIDGQTIFTVDIIRNGLSIDVLSKDEIEKYKKTKLKVRKKPETNIFLEKINQATLKHRTGKARKANDLIRQAEIYEVSFIINERKFVYVGQDSYCSGEHYYFGSSMLTDFVKLVYGENIFKKRILHNLENIKQKDLNKKEWDYIYNARSECRKNGWININGEVQSYN